MRERPRPGDVRAQNWDGAQEPGRNYAYGNPGAYGNPEAPGNPGADRNGESTETRESTERRPPQPPRKRRRQRSIRSTVTLLLIIPLVTLIGLLGYSIVTTVPGFLADRDSNALTKDVGPSLEGLVAQLDRESSLTYSASTLGEALAAAQSMPPAQRATMRPAQLRQKDAQLKTVQGELAGVQRQMMAQRPKTDAAVAAFQSSQAKAAAAGLETPQAASLAATLSGQLRNLDILRDETEARTASALTVFEGYGTIINAIFPYAAKLPDTREPASVYARAMGTTFMDQSRADIVREQILGDGALADHGVVTAPVYQVLQQTIEAQRQLDQSGTELLGVANTSGTDPYAEALASPRFKAFQALEDQVIAAGPDSRQFPAAWTQDSRSALGALNGAGMAERLKIARNSTHAKDMKAYELLGVSGLGLLLVLLSSMLLLRFGNRVTRELRSLRAAARGLAFQRLPGVVSRLRTGEDLDIEAEAAPLDLNTRTLEVTETADAFSAVQRTAVQAAIDQAVLRHAVSNVFRRLARRNQSLLQRQLKMLDEMERGTQDPDALGQLFRLDHLTTRMRRQAEGLIILSGAAPGRGWRQPVQVVEVLRGAVGEIEDYVRVDITTDSPDYLQGRTIADVTHLLAELIENAVAYSPPDTRVLVRGGRVANGYAIEIEDRGLGIPAEVMDALNQRLAKPPDFDVADSDQLGLFVVSRLAARHGIKVLLRPSAYGGTAAIALLPNSLIVTPEEASRLASQEQSSPSVRRNSGPMRAIGTGPEYQDGQEATVTGDPADLPRRERMANLPPRQRKGS